MRTFCATAATFALHVQPKQQIYLTGFTDCVLSRHRVVRSWFRTCVAVVCFSCYSCFGLRYSAATPFTPLNTWNLVKITDSSTFLIVLFATGGQVAVHNNQRARREQPRCGRIDRGSPRDLTHDRGVHGGRVQRAPRDGQQGRR